MVAYDDGFRICNRLRQPLAAIDTSYLLKPDELILILAAGVRMDDGDQMLAASSDQYIWRWRRVGGSFAQFSNSGELRVCPDGGGTVLINGTVVTTANKRTNLTPIAIETLGEITTSGPGIVPSDVLDQRSSESQIAVIATHAVPGASYEFQVEYTHTGGANTVDYSGRITIPNRPHTYCRSPKFRKW